MSGSTSHDWRRRDFLTRSALAVGAAGLLGATPRLAAAEPPPETTRLRVHHSMSLCQAPQYVAEDLLRGEGFTNIQYVSYGPDRFYQTLGSGEVDVGGDFAPELVLHVDRGTAIVVLSGLHV